MTAANCVSTQIKKNHLAKWLMDRSTMQNHKFESDWQVYN